MAKSDVLVRMKADTTGYDANIAKARRQLDSFKKDNLSIGGVMKQLSGSLISAAGSFASVTAAVGALSSAIMGNIETARNFEKSMSQLSSLTGMTGKDLNQLKEYAIELGSSTTLSASQVADAFKMIGSQQPQLLASGEALKEVTKYAITLSEAAGIDLQTAAQTLSTSVNQMGGDSANAARYVNVLAAASQKGAGDIAWLGEALTKSATAAKAVGTDYEELVANLEQLAKAGFDASTAGTALRSIIMNLEKQTNSQFKPSVVGLTQAFENLGKAHLNISQYQDLIGKMFATQAMALADAAGEARKMTDAITGTNTAEEQAKTNTDNLDGSLKSLASAWEGLNLHINSSNGLLKDAVDGMTNMVRVVDNMVTSVGNSSAWDTYIAGVKKVTAAVVDSITPLRHMYNLLTAIGGSTGGGLAGGAGIGGVLGKVVGGKGGSAVPKLDVGGGYTYSGSSGGGSTPKVTPHVTTASEVKEVLPVGSIAEMSEKLKQLKHDQDRVTDTASWKKLQNEIDILTTKMSVLRGEIKDPNKVDSSSGVSVVGMGTDIKAPEKIDMKNVTNLKNGGKDVADSWKNAANAISTVGSALSSIEDPAAKVMGTIAQAIASVALAAGQAIAAKDTTSSGWAWIGAAAAITATMISTIASIHQATGYAQGGVVEGNSYSGDNIPIMANAQEVVLTKAQTASLADHLQNGGGGVRVSGEIHGETIVLAANRYLRRSGRGELVTWR